MELFQARHRQVLPHLQAHRLRLALGLPLDLVELTVVGQSLVGGRGVAVPRLMELAPRMGMASYFFDACPSRLRVAQVQRIVTREGIRLQITGKALQELLRSITLAVGGESEHVV